MNEKRNKKSQKFCWIYYIKQWKPIVWFVNRYTANENKKKLNKAN